MIDEEASRHDPLWEAYEMVSRSRSQRGGLNVRHRVAATAVAMVLVGFYHQAGAAGPTPSLKPKPRPELKLAMQPPAKPGNVQPGAALTIHCTVASKPGGFEPIVTIFQTSDPNYMLNGRNIGKASLDSRVIRDREQKGSSYTYTYEVKAPEKPGRYVIEARAIGVDPSRPRIGPPEAPSVDGTRAKPGARGDYSAPLLEFEVKAK